MDLSDTLVLCFTCGSGVARGKSSHRTPAPIPPNIELNGPSSSQLHVLHQRMCSRLQLDLKVPLKWPQHRILAAGAQSSEVLDDPLNWPSTYQPRTERRRSTLFLSMKWGSLLSKRSKRTRQNKGSNYTESCGNPSSSAAEPRGDESWRDPGRVSRDRR